MQSMIQEENPELKRTEIESKEEKKQKEKKKKEEDKTRSTRKKHKRGIKKKSFVVSYTAHKSEKGRMHKTPVKPFITVRLLLL